MKEKVLNWLKFDRTFETGAALYQRHGNNLSLKRTINVQGNSEYNHQMLIAELTKMAEIHPEDVQHILSLPVSKKTTQPKAQETPEIVVEEVPEVVTETPKPQSAEDKVAIEAVKKAIRLRDEFPFLKDASCPNELKILVADMLTSYDKYKAAHEGLFSPADEEALVADSKETVEEYLNNRAIWEELTYYRDHKEILGNHVIFTELKEIAVLSKMSAQDLAKKKNNLRSNISQAKAKIEEGKNPDMTQSRLETIASKERMILEIDRLLAKK